MNKPDFLELAKDTWAQLRRFPTGDALADAVLLNALFQLFVTPFAFRRYLPLQKWNLLALPLKIFSTPTFLFRHFDLSRRLRRNEEQARRTAIAGSLLSLLMVGIDFGSRFHLRNGISELNEAEKESLTEEQLASHEKNLAKWQDPAKKPLFTPIIVLWCLVNVTLSLNVLFRAFQPGTRARFRTP